MISKMITKAYYFELNNSLISAINYLEDVIPCLIRTEPVEMNWVLLTITCPEKDAVLVEETLAPLI